MRTVACIALVIPLAFSGVIGAGKDPAKSSATGGVVLSFITINGFGNNLYLDNIRLGTPMANDVAVLPLSNIRRDTSYTAGSSPVVIAPRAAVLNCGTGTIASTFSVTLSAAPGGYSSTKTVASLGPGQYLEVVFDNLTITPGVPLSLSCVSNLSADQNHANDTVRQSSAYLAGAKRLVLFEEGTNSSCGPCANANPTLDAFIASKFDSLCAIKYHAWWPGNTDPMYVANTSQNADRINYYSINGVPDLKIDGVLDVYPLLNLQNPLSTRLAAGSPFGISVTDSRVPGDSIVSDVTVQVVAPVRGGIYRLRVAAVERHIAYTTAPGTNGEKDFYDVFRQMFPGSAGAAVSTSPGTYHFQYRYKRAPAWVDSLIYSVAFIQDDNTLEVMNCAKGRAHLFGAAPPIAGSSPVQGNTDTRVCRLEGSSGTFASEARYEAAGSAPVLNVEPFEGTFPPAGWRVANPDKQITFAQYLGVNGPSYGGVTSIKMAFYDYGALGRVDTLFSPAFSGLSGSDSLKFDWAYAHYPGSNDRLIVKLSTDGGKTYPYVVFDRDSSTLPTAPMTPNSFMPTSSNWKTFACSLSPLGAIEPGFQAPGRFELSQNYPNPFNPTTVIEFTLPAAGHVSLKIFDIVGREVRTLIEGQRPAGTQSVSFDAHGLTSGVYFYTLRAGEYYSARPMLLIR